MWEAAPRGLRRAVAVECARADDADDRVCVKLLHQASKCVRDDKRVRVEQQDMSAMRLHQAQIVAAHETEIVLLGEHLYFWKARAQHGDRIVRAGRVDNDNLGTERRFRQASINRIEALCK